MILVCGGLADIVTELVCARLEHMGEPYRLLDLGRYPVGFQVDWSWSGNRATGSIRGTDWSLDLEEIQGVFVRYLGLDGHVPFDTIPDGLDEAVLAESQAGLMALLETLHCTVANRVSASMANHSKPYQALLVRDSGLKVPRTLVTNDPKAALEFSETCQHNTVFKSLSGVRSIVRRLETRDLVRLPLLRHGPVQFQQFIPGDNVRVHTVGETVIATRVRSEAVDYRYAKQQGFEARLEPTELPSHVARSCLELSRTSGLVLAGIDLKETPDGEYFCFEVNPSPGFAFYEQHTGQPISAAVVELLRAGTQNGVGQRR